MAFCPKNPKENILYLVVINSNILVDIKVSVLNSFGKLHAMNFGSLVDLLFLKIIDLHFRKVLVVIGWLRGYCYEKGVCFIHSLIQN